MMKKLVALLIALSMIFGVCAWAEESETPVSEILVNPADTTTETDAPATLEEEETLPDGEEAGETDPEGETEPEEAKAPEEEDLPGEETPAETDGQTEGIEEPEAALPEEMEVSGGEELTGEAGAATIPDEEPATPEPEMAKKAPETGEPAPETSEPALETIEPAGENEPIRTEETVASEPAADVYVEAPVEEAAPADVAAASVYAEAPAEEAAPADVLTDAQVMVLPMSSYADENSARGFVYRLYRTVFQREPDEGGLRYWVDNLESGRNSAADVVNFFFNSPEYQRSGKTNEQIVSDFYNTMLNRNPDEGGYQYWKQRLDIGMTPQTLLAGFLFSNEFREITSKYGLVRGNFELTDPRDKNYERTYFVYRLYQNCLGRKPDAGGQEFWCRALENGVSGGVVANGFFFSDEFNKNRYNNSTFVQHLYRAIMGREYDTGGLIYWTNRLNLADTREKTLNGFIQSAEFRKQCEVAGIQPGELLPTPDDSVEWQYNIRVLQLCNQARAQAGLANLYTREDLLWDLAVQRAWETTEQFSHTRPDGTSCFTLFKEEGFYGYLGENLAAGTPYADPVKVVEAWMNSPGHKENIMNPNFTYLATGYVYSPGTRSYCAEGKYAGQYVDFESYAAQSFCNYGTKIK